MSETAPVSPSSGRPTENRPADRPLIAELRGRWGWFVGLGIAFVVIGSLALVNTLAATIASIFTIAVLMLVGAGMQIAQAFTVKTWGSFFWWLLAGVVYFLGGLAAIRNPLLASSVLTLLLAAFLVASGLIRMVAGFKARPRGAWAGFIVSGAVTLLAGVLIALGWPVNSLWVLGLFLAIDLLLQGWSMIAFGLALRRGPPAEATR